MNKLLFFIIAIGLSIGLYFVFQSNPTVMAVNNEVKVNNDFSENNIVTMQVDSFIATIKKAYGNAAIITKLTSEVTVEVKAGILSSDFYNNNSNLISKKNANAAFEILDNKEQKLVVAKFKITNSTLQVPADVLLKAIDKTQNAKKQTGVKNDRSK